jgi:hypothetical protein
MVARESMTRPLFRGVAFAVVATLFFVLFTTIASRQSTFAQTTGRTTDTALIASQAPGSTDGLVLTAANRAATSRASTAVLHFAAHSSEPALLALFGLAFVTLALLLRFPVRSAADPVSSRPTASTRQEAA